MGRNTTVELLQGTLDLLILKTLSWGPTHGYGVARWIQQTAEDVLRIEEGSLYPALHRLERAGVITSEWGLSENNRRARWYRLTPAGRQRLRAELTAWSAFSGAVAKVLAAVPDGRTARA
jgi:PadR family transcriptional regulator, regulatory protein PadR